MGRYSLRFIFGTGLVLLTIVILVILGLWQLKRYEYKLNYTHQILNLDPKSFAPIEEIIVNLKYIPDVNFVKVRLKGIFHHDLSIDLIPRTLHGQTGAHVYTPFLIIPSGHMIMVNRGWVPEKKDHLKFYQQTGAVEIFGYLQQPTLPGWMTPDNVADKKAWYYLDLEAMQDVIAADRPEIGKKMLPFYMISMEKPHRDEFPKPIDVMTMVKNNHFGYALTWFSLAIALAIMYIFYLRNNRVV